MKHRSSKVLSKFILENMQIDHVIYAEATPPGAMGNAGGIIIYILENEHNKVVCYENNLRYNEEAYLLAEDLLMQNTIKSDRKDLPLIEYWGGMGNCVFINKEIKLDIRDGYFSYTKDGIQFDIIPSVIGVFNVLTNQLKTLYPTWNDYRNQ